MGQYFEELRAAMEVLVKEPRTVFVGQSIVYDGHALFRTLKYPGNADNIVPMNRRIEMPVIEDFQMGFCTGLALAGAIPVCIFPRMDFLLLATNQLVNHLDKIPLQSSFRPKVIIRAAVGATKPLHSGLQHTQDHTWAFQTMLKSVKVEDLRNPNEIVPCYRRALEREGSTLLIERQDLYNA